LVFVVGGGVRCGDDDTKASDGNVTKVEPGSTCVYERYDYPSKAC